MTALEARERSPTTRPASWTIESEPRALVLRLARPARAASSAVLGGGIVEIDAIVNHAIRPEEEAALAEPEAWLRAVCLRLGLDPARTAALATGVDPRHAVVVEDALDGVPATVAVTAGLSNALRVGDPATIRAHAPGTINLIAVVGAAMTDAALVEAVALATEARTVATLEAGVRSAAGGGAATGTGTDALVVAALVDGPRFPHCGKHTSLGELLGRAALAAATRAIRGAGAAIR